MSCYNSDSVHSTLHLQCCCAAVSHSVPYTAHATPTAAVAVVFYATTCNDVPTQSTHCCTMSASWSGSKLILTITLPTLSHTFRAALHAVIVQGAIHGAIHARVFNTGLSLFAANRAAELRGFQHTEPLLGTTRGGRCRGPGYHADS